MTTETLPNQTDVDEMYQKARKTLVDYRYILLTNDQELEAAPAEFHFDWSDKLLNGTKNTAIEAFRESAKSSYVLRTFPLYCLTFPEKKHSYIVILKNNATMAESKLEEIRNEYLSNPLISANMVKIIKQSSKVFEVEVEDDKGEIINVRIQAYGKGSSIRGLSNQDRRPQIIIADDLQDLEDTESETVVEKDWKWFLSDVFFLGKICRVFLIGNNLGEKCIIERVIANKDELKYDTVKIPAINEKGESAWSAYYKIEDIEAQRESFRRLGKLDIWVREKMCQSIADENRVFQKKYFRYYVPAMAKKMSLACNLYIRTDIAFTMKTVNDFSCLGCGGFDDKNNFFMFDIVYGRWGSDPKRFIDELFAMYRRWPGVQNVGIEKVQAQTMLEPLIQRRQSEEKCFFPIIEQIAEKKKEIRIRALQPLYKAQKIYHPDEAPWLAEFESELLAFDKGLHDDLIDMLAYFLQETECPLNEQELGNLPRETVRDNTLDTFYRVTENTRLPRSYSNDTQL